jgi:trk system potassium uptake protein TrkH
MLLKVTGWLLMIEAAFMLVPTVTCAIYHENDILPFAVVTAITFIVGFLMCSIRTSHTHMGRRDGFLLTATVWLWFSAFGMIPFIFCDAHFSITDAFFEAMSGFTTTGASMVDNYTNVSHGVNIWRILMQWIGGMGIILFTLAVLPTLNSAGGLQMFNAEVTGITHDKIRPRISSTAKALWGTYITLTALGIVILWMGPMDLFECICYGMSAIATGGFAPTTISLGELNSDYSCSIITLFMFLGGVNFSLLFGAATGRAKALFKNEVFRVYVLAILLYTVLFDINTLLQTTDVNWQSMTIYPMFQVLSTITSTGLDCGNFVWWSPLVVVLSMSLMFGCACAGSTTGGAKLDRIIFLFKNLHNEVRRCVRPNAILSVKVDGKVKSSTVVDKVTAFMCIYVMLAFVGGVTLTAMNLPIVDSFFISLSSVSNTGIGPEIIGHGLSFTDVPAIGKWGLTFLMLVGRLELFTVLILFSRSFWRK